MSQNGAGSQAAPNSSTQTHMRPAKECEYNSPLTKADLDASLTAIYEKLADKIQLELHKLTNALSQEIANIGSRTDVLETKHDELSLAHSDLRRDYETLADSFSFMQAHVEDLDNRNRRNNIRVRGIPESTIDSSLQCLKSSTSLCQISLCQPLPVTGFTEHFALNHLLISLHVI